MSEPTPDEVHLVNRRLFLQYASIATAASAGAIGMALKTDALAKQQVLQPTAVRANGDEGMPYPYHGG